VDVAPHMLIRPGPGNMPQRPYNLPFRNDIAYCIL
jgi:hypothetical protein